MKPDGSSLVVKDATGAAGREGRSRSDERQADGGDPRRTARQRHVQGRVDDARRRTATSRTRPGRSPWRSPRRPPPTVVPSAAATAAASAVPTPVPATPGRDRRAGAVTLGRWLDHGERQRRRPADHRRADRARRRSRVPPDPTQPPDRPGVIRGEPASVASLGGPARRGARRGEAIALAVPADRRGSHDERHVREPAAARGLRRRRGRHGRPVVHLRHRPRRPGGPARPDRRGPPPAGLDPLAVARASDSSAGPGSSPRASPADRATATSRRCSCGSTAGSGSRSCARSSARSGSSSTRSRRSTTSARPSSGRSTSRAGTSPTTRPHSVAGRRRPGSPSSSGSSSSSRRVRRSCSSSSSATRR